MMATYPLCKACAVALGTMRDEDSIPTLEEMADSSSPVRLAAWTALYRLGKKGIPDSGVRKTATEHDPFAISALGEMEGSEETLFQLMNENNLQVRINAALALLGEAGSALPQGGRRGAATRCTRPGLYQSHLARPGSLCLEGGPLSPAGL